jgi:hypothetical protein
MAVPKANNYIVHVTIILSRVGLGRVEKINVFCGLGRVGLETGGLGWVGKIHVLCGLYSAGWVGLG